MALVVAVVLLATAGCVSSPEWVSVRDTPANPLATSLNLLGSGGPEPTPRTRQLLRRYDLEKALSGSRAELVAQLEDINSREPQREIHHAMAELAYLAAKRSEPLNNDAALEYYGTALMHAYRYLFDNEAAPANPYDPQFRGASDLYNQSLEGMLRIVRTQGELQPGSIRTIETANHTCQLEVVVHANGWHNDDFERFEFVSDYRVEGLRNHYRSFGLGVPLIAIRRKHDGEDVAEQFYPSNLAFPITAFLKVSSPEGDVAPPRFVLELYNPLEQQSIDIAGSAIPLESDLSTPLAYFLSQPELAETDIGTLGLLFPERVEQLQGLYMLEPFQPEKMPVVMVHGLWSSPLTWMEMFNDLRSDPMVREHYQFWFYLYPTGQPFWVSAARMREDLALLRRQVDPAGRHAALDQTVLIGHSMGGLVSKLQSVESGDAFWQTMSDRPFAELSADEQLRKELAHTFFFEPNASIRRVVTIGTPHRGSRFANGITRWLGSKVITLPRRMIQSADHLLAGNGDYFKPDAPLGIQTSLDSLDPESPVLPVLLDAGSGPWVAYHNIVGRAPNPGWRDRFVGTGDGVVSLESARLDSARQVRSQIEVPADHVSVHRHPQSILEVRRVLFDQLAELRTFPGNVRLATHSENYVDPGLPSQPPTPLRPLPPVTP